MSKTREEALALAAANFEPAIATTRRQIESLETLLAERIDAVYQLPGVVAAQQQIATWQQTLSDRIAQAMVAPAVVNPLTNLQDARLVLMQRESVYAARVAAINAHFDELARRSATQAIVDTVPDEAK